MCASGERESMLCGKLFRPWQTGLCSADGQNSTHRIRVLEERALELVELGSGVDHGEHALGDGSTLGVTAF